MDTPTTYNEERRPSVGAPLFTGKHRYRLLPDDPDDRSLVPSRDDPSSPLELALRLEPLMPPELLLPLDPLMPPELLERSHSPLVDGLRVAELPTPSSFWLPRSVRLPSWLDEAPRPVFDSLDLLDPLRELLTLPESPDRLEPAAL